MKTGADVKRLIEAVEAYEHKKGILDGSNPSLEALLAALFEELRISCPNTPFPDDQVLSEEAEICFEELSAFISQA